MNEQTQIDMIVRELRAAGWKVEQDVRAEKHGLPSDMPDLDLIAWTPEEDMDAPGPHRLIIEIANRQRRWLSDDGSSVLADAHWAEADEREALRRVNAIADGLEDLPPDRVGFQIRFLDVSVDQAQARGFRKFSFAPAALRGELYGAAETLKKLDAKEGAERALVIATTWTRWLRILGKVFPGREHVELPLADIRTIQKDLYDAGVIETHPADYFVVHQSILALAEGGEVEWRRLEGLQGDLLRVLRLMAERYDVVDLFRPESPSRGRQGVEEFDRAETLVKTFADADDRDGLMRQFQRLRETDGTPAYRQALIDFEAMLPTGNPVLNSLLVRLRRLTAFIRN